MDVRYDVWNNCKMHDERMTWILRQMQTFLKQNERTRWIDFKFYLDESLYATLVMYMFQVPVEDSWNDGKKTFNHVIFEVHTTGIQ